MAREYTREIYLYINGKQINNDIKSIRAEMQLLVNEQAKMRIRGPRGENQVSERHSERTFRAIEKHEPVVERNHGRHGRLVQPVPGCGGSCNCNHCGLPGSELYPPRPSLKPTLYTQVFLLKLVAKLPIYVNTWNNNSN